MAFNLEEFAKKYYVHPETIDFLKARQADGSRPYYEIGVEAARKASAFVSAKYGGSISFDGTEQEFIVPSPFDTEGIPITLYRPAACDYLTATPMLVYFHGGGNTIGSRQTYETVCKFLARESPCIVVNVEYRLAPEHKFPANHDDAKCVVEWVAINKETLGGTVNSKLGVAGDSAGGRLAAVVCHEAKGLIDFAVLIYPNVSCMFEHPSVQEFHDGPSLTWNVINWFMENYISEEEKSTVRASPIRNKDFSQLPPTLMIIAELDPLRDGCYDYYEKLKSANVNVVARTIKGVPHGFFSLRVAFKETCKEAHTMVVQFIQQFVA